MAGPELLGQDLRRPQFLISIHAAMSRRLQRNYLWMFLILSAGLGAQDLDAEARRPKVWSAISHCRCP